MTRETFYVLEDETSADPADVSPGKDGLLVHKDGRKVAYAPHGPRSRSVDAEAERKRAKPKADPKPVEKPAEKPSAAVAPNGKPDSPGSPLEAKDLKAEPAKSGYATRESKAR